MGGDDDGKKVQEHKEDTHKREDDDGDIKHGVKSRACTNYKYNNYGGNRPTQLSSL